MFLTEESIIAIPWLNGEMRFDVHTDTHIHTETRIAYTGVPQALVESFEKKRGTGE